MAQHEIFPWVLCAPEGCMSLRMYVLEADLRNPHRIDQVQIVNFLTGPLVIKDDLFGKAYCTANAKITGVEMEIVEVIN